eukprot:TRINITY_DN20861_c0_g1_i1.p1 TRINITY_DN20861_c0_g1~~TRINITY_DN20861_c0_g1_i1.p1  ORF type:complete len:182 (-),score=21.59 TRINITY_DN20861_c0_g1_i1:62-607(-)
MFGSVSGLSMMSPTAAEDDSGCLNLDRSTRFMAFALFCGAALVFYALAIPPLWFLAIRKFAFFVTVANILAITSTGFLVGFQRQARSIFEKERFLLAATFIAAMIFTLYGAIEMQSVVVAVGCLVAQVVSLFMYALSYIPFGRQVLTMATQPCRATVRVLCCRLCGQREEPPRPQSLFGFV